MGWQFKGDLMTSSCSFWQEQQWVDCGESEPTFKNVPAGSYGFGCSFDQIIINGSPYGNQPYGFIPGTGKKRYIGDGNKFDCINGSCIKANIYNTPGQYATLQECQNNCSSGSNSNSCNPPFQCIDPTNFCPPGKVCLEQNEWTQITGLIAQNKAKHCK